MDNVAQKPWTRCGAGACFFLDARVAGLEDFFLEEAFRLFELLLGGDLGFLTGMGNFRTHAVFEKDTGKRL